MMTGYLHSDYASSLAEFGTPLFLSLSGGWIIRRQIPNSCHFDAMGCYPLFTCQDWSQLDGDLKNIGNSLVCLSVVTDPFGEYVPAFLKHCFPDVTTPFKEHFVVDLGRIPERFVHPHHRRNTRKSLREVRVEECANPIVFLDDWLALYGNLIRRHQIKGIAAFSPASFEKQLRVPGIVMLRAVSDDSTAGILLWYAHGNRAYYHLGAYSERGYELRASFALFDYSLTYFADHGFEWLSLGGGAGAGTPEEMGLRRFKQGWSTGTRTAYFCGRILNPERYRELSEARSLSQSTYFPAYRSGEFS